MYRPPHDLRHPPFHGYSIEWPGTIQDNTELLVYTSTTDTKTRNRSIRDNFVLSNTCLHEFNTYACVVRIYAVYDQCQ